MTNPFQDLQTALSNATGMDYTLAGICLGAILTVALLIMLIFILDPKAKGKGDSTFLISAGIGIAISTAVGWFPIWIAIFIGILVTFVLVDPLSSRSHGA